MEQFFGDTNVTDKYVAFWGGVFSNFYPCNIEAEGHSFKSSEQYFMWQKATYFMDDVIAQAILDAKTPSQAKQLGRRVSGYDDETWAKVRLHAMFNAVYLKFSQNDELKKIIISDDLKGKHVVEGSPIDKIWGVGVKWDDPAIADEKNWQGENLLGLVLDNVRIALLQE